MKIRKDKIEVKVKEEEVKVAEITLDEFNEIAAQCHADLLSTAIDSYLRKTGKSYREIEELADMLTTYAAVVVKSIGDAIFDSDEEE